MNIDNDVIELQAITDYVNRHYGQAIKKGDMNERELITAEMKRRVIRAFEKHYSPEYSALMYSVDIELENEKMDKQCRISATEDEIERLTKKLEEQQKELSMIKERIIMARTAMARLGE